MPAAKPIASAAGLIQAIKGAREPLLVAHTLMDNASMQSSRCNISNYSSYRLVTIGPLCAGLASRGITGGLLV